MLKMFQEFVRHKEYANAALLKSVRHHDAATHDEGLRALLHHIILANRFWFSLMRGSSLQVGEESRVPDSFEAVAELYLPPMRKSSNGSLRSLNPIWRA